MIQFDFTWGGCRCPTHLAGCCTFFVFLSVASAVVWHLFSVAMPVVVRWLLTPLLFAPGLCAWPAALLDLLPLTKLTVYRRSISARADCSRAYPRLATPW